MTKRSRSETSRENIRKAIAARQEKWKNDPAWAASQTARLSEAGKTAHAKVRELKRTVERLENELKEQFSQTD